MQFDRRSLTRRLALLAGVFVLATPGCRSALHPGVTVEHQPGREARTCQVPYTATYQLFAVNPDGSAVGPIERASVEKRAHVGFVWQPDGSFVAYAHGRQIPLPDGHYVWRISPETQRTHRDLFRARVGKAAGTACTAVMKVGVVAMKVAGAYLIAAAHVAGR